MKDLSYRIISYDPREIGLMSITQKAVTDSLKLIGLKLSPETIECEGCDELEIEWKKLGTYEDDKFYRQLSSIYREATKQLSSPKKHRAILVTSKDIGKRVGVSYAWIVIISSCQVNNDLDTVTTAVYHELGHIHGLPDKERENLGECFCDDKIIKMEKDNTESERNAIFECLGLHCLNIGCSMRQRLCFDNWKEHLTKERLPDKPYCDKCLADLKLKFKNASDYDEGH